MQNTMSAPISIGFLPNLSLNGPSIISPTPSPIIPNVRPSCTVDVVVWNDLTISGSVGRYMSLTNDPNALNITR